MICIIYLISKFKNNLLLDFLQIEITPLMRYLNQKYINLYPDTKILCDFFFQRTPHGVNPCNSVCATHTFRENIIPEITRVNMNDAELVTQTKTWRLDRTIFLHFLFQWQWNNTVLDIFLIMGSCVYKTRREMLTANSINNLFLTSLSVNRSFSLAIFMCDYFFL